MQATGDEKHVDDPASSVASTSRTDSSRPSEAHSDTSTRSSSSQEQAQEKQATAIKEHERTHQLFDRAPFKRANQADEKERETRQPLPTGQALAASASGSVSVPTRDTASGPDLPGGGIDESSLRVVDTAESAARAAGESPHQQVAALSEQLQALAACVRAEQQARCTAEAELGRAEAERSALHEKLADAELRAAEAAEEASVLRQRVSQLEKSQAGMGETVTVTPSGVGKLDPNTVFESLPLCLQRAFELRDSEALHAALGTLTEEEVEHHMGRCVEAGLWDVNGGE